MQVPELLEADREYLQKLYGGDVLSESDLCFLYWGESEIGVETIPLILSFELCILPTPK